MRISPLSFRLIAPIFFGVLIICVVFTSTLHVGKDRLLNSYVELQAFEYAEMFLLATEVNSSAINIQRTVSVMGTYSDIEEVLLLGDGSHVVASNKSRHVGQNITQLADDYLTVLQRLNRQGGRHWLEYDGKKYLLAYRVKLLAADNGSKRNMTLLIRLYPKSMHQFFHVFVQKVFLVALGVSFIVLLVLVLVVRKALLQPLAGIVDTMQANHRSIEPVWCEHKGDDELGVLVKTYNNLLAHDRRVRDELEEANSRLQALSEIDALTQVPNRRRFDQQLMSEWNRALRNEYPLGLLMIDVDHFKQVNDSYGHLAGDQCLQRVAACLNAQIGRSGDFVSRMGGEEFCILVPHGNDNVMELAERCRSAVEHMPIELEELQQVVNLTVSIGVTVLSPTTDKSPQFLIECSDIALYQAKSAGRNCIERYSVGAGGN